MARYWYRHRYYHRRNNTPKPEELGVLLLMAMFLFIFVPQTRQLFSQIWYIYTFGAAVLLFLVANKVYKQYRLSKAGIDEVDKMSGQDFENFLCSLFSKLGYKVQHTGHTGDLGSDLIIEMGGARIAVQAKRYQENVGPDAVREVNTVIKPRNCTSGWVVTNSHFTEEAKELARANNIILWDREELINNILKSKEQREIPACPKCSAIMVLRTSQYGEFWGCSNYPQCDGTRNFT